MCRNGPGIDIDPCGRGHRQGLNAVARCQAVHNPLTDRRLTIWGGVKLIPSVRAAVDDRHPHAVGPVLDDQMERTASCRRASVTSSEVQDSTARRSTSGSHVASTWARMRGPSLAADCRRASTLLRVANSTDTFLPHEGCQLTTTLTSVRPWPRLWAAPASTGSETAPLVRLGGPAPPARGWRSRPGPATCAVSH
jgi:hypothetical protein